MHNRRVIALLKAYADAKSAQIMTLNLELLAQELSSVPELRINQLMYEIAQYQKQGVLEITVSDGQLLYRYLKGDSP